MDVAITGSTGLIGGALVERLRAHGHGVRRMVRPTTHVRDVSDGGDTDTIAWDPAAGRVDAGALEGVDAVVNLAGRPIGSKRWTPEEKRLIRDSRVDGTRVVAEAVAGLDRKPSVLVNASAIGIYGNRGDEVLTEDSAPGDGFLADLVVDWEAAARPAVEAGIRTVLVRTSIVLHPGEQVLGRMLLPFRLGLGGRLGTGRQWWSWIALHDEVGAIEHLLSADVSGPVNLTAPNPVTNLEFTKTLGRILRRPTVVPVPKAALQLMFGREMAEEVPFAGQRVSSARLEASGYEFAHPHLEPALRSMLGRTLST